MSGQSPQENSSSYSSAFELGIDLNNAQLQIDKKLKLRQEKIKTESNFALIKETAINSDLILGTNAREKIFKNYRRRMKPNLETSESLKSKLTIPLQIYEEINKSEVLRSDLSNWVKAFTESNDPIGQYKALVGLRKLVSFSTNPPIQEVIDYGLVPKFIETLDYQYPEFQYEALWSLTNIASGTSDQVNTIVVKGGLGKIVFLMDSTIEEIKSQAIWAIGNIGGDSQVMRDEIITSGGYEKIWKVFSTTRKPSIIKTCTWALSNITRTRPIMSYDLLKPCIDLIVKGLEILPNDQEFLVEALWILSFLTENYKQSIKELIDREAISIIVKCLEIIEMNVQWPCLRIAGNIASGNANQTQLLIDCGIVPHLRDTINNPNKSIRYETAWILSNIAAGTQAQIGLLIASDFLPALIEIIRNDDDDIQNEAIWAVCNFTLIEKDELMGKLLQQNIIDVWYIWLQMEETKYWAISWEALNNWLMYGARNPGVNGENVIVNKVEMIGMFDILEKWQNHSMEIVYEKVSKILEKYFEENH